MPDSIQYDKYNCIKYNKYVFQATPEQTSPQKEKPKVWEKQQKKKKGGKGRKKPVKKETYTKKIPTAVPETLAAGGGDSTPKGDEESNQGTPNGVSKVSRVFTLQFI